MFLYQNLSKFFLRNSRSFLEFIFILQTIFMLLNSYINFIGMEFIDLKLLLTYSWKSYRLNNLNNPDLFHLSIFASHRLNSLNWLHFYWTWSFLSSFDFLIIDHYFLLLTHLDCFLMQYLNYQNRCQYCFSFLVTFTLRDRLMNNRISIVQHLESRFCLQVNLLIHLFTTYDLLFLGVPF